MEKDDRELLRERRSRLAKDRERKTLRDQNGVLLAALASEACGVQLTLDDFDPDAIAHAALGWTGDVREAPGAVAAYMGRAEAERLLDAIDATLGMVDAQVGFLDREYMGLAQVQGLRIPPLLDLADRLEDSVVIHVRDPVAAIMIDCYKSPPDAPYSIVVQGDEALVRKLEAVFPRRDPRVIAYDYHDGAREGLIRSFLDGRDVYFLMVAWDAGQDERLFVVVPLEHGEFSRTQAMLSQANEIPGTPVWVPAPGFADPADAAALDRQVAHYRSRIGSGEGVLVQAPHIEDANPAIRPIEPADCERIAGVLATGMPGSLMDWGPVDP